MSKNIFITGVSSGIGHGLAAEYLQRGDVVYGVSRREPHNLTVHEKFHFAELDLTDYEKMAPVCKTLLHNTTELELVVLNAGILSPIRDMVETPLEDLQQAMEINVWANKMLLDWLLQSGKIIRQVVGISSGAAVNGHRGWNGYSLSKAALNMLIQLYAAERPDIHFTALAPGLIDTDMQAYMSGLPKDERFPSIEALKNARGTAAMPTPDAAAPLLIKAFNKVKSLENGEFTDVRTLQD
ncbi:MAG: SDR family NAD(P)-dependent oxidoreductase [Candidatus Marinimicrobia bacterium]|nr:SDR family NAD(P)-dependent oxidoreductase [Candidatus Neomarinimicrobiota bacterium]MCF7840229.1 SDR family NAD(P)-dependent oxidoreductase [Candidatus Neomarinimicrobiota bacterium]MCF7902503.1 SDR family NAD(P)-dependent oxidoreductase [Candidatus Neomarinimicrobiota bacterium]